MPLHQLPDAVFESLPTGRDEVLTKLPKAVDADRWRRELAARALPEPSAILAESGIVVLARADVFGYADTEPNPEASLQLLYASLAWGLGTKGSHLTGRLDGLGKDRDGAVDLLVSAWQDVRKGADPQRCYEDLVKPGGVWRAHLWKRPSLRHQVPVFRPRFENFTAMRHPRRGRRREASRPRCVAQGCHRRVVSKHLRQLLRTDDQWAEQAANRMGRDVAADEVESAIFNG